MQEILELFKNKLIKEYGYDEQDIEIDVKLNVLIDENHRYIPDIVVYKDQKPYIIIEIKGNYSNRFFEQAFEKVSQATRFLDAKYCVIATLDFIEAYEFKNNEFYAVSNIPTKTDFFVEKQLKRFSEIDLKYLFAEIKDILWSGGKRDIYTVINEFNKILFAKYYVTVIQKNFNRFVIHNDNRTLEFINNLFRDANFEFKIFEDSDKINLNQKEIEKIVNILETIELSSINIDSIYFDVFIKDLNNGEVFLSEDAVTVLSNILDETQQTLITNSGFGQLSLASNSKMMKFSLIEPNSIKYRTNLVLQMIKGIHSKHQLSEFLDDDTFEYDTFRQIVSTPPLNIRRKEYKFYQLSKYTSGTDISALYIEKSLNLLHENGLLFVAISDSILSNQMFSYVRDYIKQSCQIIAILSFDDGMFLNTKIPSSLLILKKQKSHDYHVLVKNVDIKNIDQEIESIKAFIKYQQPIENTLHIDILNDRWDYHYYKKEFLEIEYKIKSLKYDFLATYVDTIRGGSLGNNKLGTINLITVGTIQNGKLDKSKLSFITDEQNDKNKRSIVRENDLVVSVVGKYPKCAKVTAEFADSNTNSGIVILRIKNGFENKIDDIYKYLNSEVGQLLLHRGVSFTSTVSILTQKELEKIPVIVRDDYDTLLTFIEQVKEIPLFKSQQDEDLEYDEQVLYDEDKNINQIMSFEGIEGKVFSLDVIRTFISLGDLKDFKTDKQNFQREIDKEHQNELVDFLTNKDYKFFPEIVVGLENIDTLKEKKLVSIIKNKNTVKLNFNVVNNSQDDIFDHIKILDGRHRIESIKTYLEKDSSKNQLTISIVFILLNESDYDSLVDRAIFYNLNAKAKHLLPDDYLNLLDSDDHDKLNTLGILNISLFKFLSKNRESIFKIKNDDKLVLKQCIDLTDYIVRHIGIEKLEDIQSQENILEVLKLVNENLLFDYNIELKTKLYKVVIYIISNVNDAHEYVQKDMSGFIEWLNISGLMNSLIDVDDLKDFYKTYQKTYVPKSRKIYISMPYHKETEWTFFLIKDVINDISRNLKITIEAIRTDQESDGVHSGIREKVYSQIENSDLMIADLTGNNPNVFNEVGFKMGLDKAKGLTQPQVIFIVNTQSYYNERFEIEKLSDNNYPDSFEVKGTIYINESKNVAFNLSAIKQITFYESYYLKAQLYKELEQYFSYYKITKVSK